MSVAALAPASLLLRQLDRLVEPEVFDFWAGHVNALWSRQRLLARVVDRRVEARGVVTLVLKPNRHWAGHAAGQHLNVSAQVNGRRLSRSYSLSGVAGDPACVSITVKRVAGGALSSHLCDRVQVGAVLGLSPAFGEMTWPDSPAGSWLFLSAGSGITPFMGLIRAMSESDWPVRVQLVHWAAQRADLCFKRQLDELAARDPRFTVRWVLTRETSALWPHERTGRVSAPLLAELCPSLDASVVRACGSAGFVAAARQAALGAPDFMAEAFSPIGAASLVTARQDAGGMPATVACVKVRLQRSGRTLDMPTDVPLLQGLREQGLNPPSGCGMGICHTCVCTKHEGSVADSQTGVRQDEPGLPIRLCVTRACSDLSLDL